MHLYEIDQQLQLVLSNADDNGVFNEEELENLSGLKKDKQLSIIQFVKELEGSGEVVEREIARLKKLQESLQRKATWLTLYLGNSMKMDGVTELDFITSKAKFKKNPAGVVIDNIELIPPRFMVTTTKIEANKKMLKEALKVDGDCVPGVHLESTTRLSIS